MADGVPPVPPAEGPRPSPPERLSLRNFLTLGTGELLARLAGFAATVWVARQLGASAYGVVGFALAVLLYFNTALEWGVDLLGPRLVAEDRSRIASLVPAVVGVRVLIAVPAAAGLILVGQWTLPEPEATVLGLYALSLLALAANTRWVHLGLESSRPVAAARTGGELVKAALVVLLVTAPQHVVRVPVAYVAGQAVAALALAEVLRRRGVGLRLRWRLEDAWPVFRKATPLAVTALLGLLLYNSDLIFLRVLRGREEVGLYLAAYALITLLGNLGNMSRYALIPTLSRLGAEGDGEGGRLSRTATAQLVALGLPLAAGGWAVAGQLIAVPFGDAFAASVSPLQVLVWSVPLLFVRTVYESVLVSRDRQGLVLRGTAWAAGANVVLNLLLIPGLGMIGAATATLCSEGLRLGMVLAFCAKLDLEIVDPRRLWKPAVATAAMLAVLLLVDPGVLWLSVPLGAAAYTGALAAVGGIRFSAGRGPALTV